MSKLYRILENKSVILYCRSSQHWSWVGDNIDEWQTINGIFYRHDLLSLISTKTFWFNEHPSSSGAAWGAKNSRGCTCAHFEYILTKQPFVIYNLHIDFPSQIARHHSIPILLSQIKDNGDHVDKVIVTGDFNNWPEQNDGDTPIDQLILLGQKASEIQQMKLAGFIDTYQHGETPSFNGFRKAGYGPKIDFVWISSNSVYRVEGETRVDDYQNKDGFFPSDHFPVYADLINTS
jgi:endonuclease/exonuclease/phosphatase family metal-dependent hydrolase